MSTITDTAAQPRDWSLDGTEATIHRAGDSCPLPTSQPNAQFTHDGRSFARHGSVIVIDGQAWHLGGPTLAVYLFRRLTEATL